MFTLSPESISAMLYFKYRKKYERHYRKDSHSIETDIKRHLAKMNGKRFEYHFCQFSNNTFPLMHNVYWSFKYACGRVNHTKIDIDYIRNYIIGGEYVALGNYVCSVIKGIRPFPEWLNNKTFPCKTQMPGLIPCSRAINERKDDLKYEIRFQGFSHWHSRDDAFNYSVTKECDIYDWLIENCAGEWYYREFASDVTVSFTDEDDAMAFKLTWT